MAEKKSARGLGFFLTFNNARLLWGPIAVPVVMSTRNNGLETTESNKGEGSIHGTQVRFCKQSGFKSELGQSFLAIFLQLIDESIPNFPVVLQHEIILWMVPIFSYLALDATHEMVEVFYFSLLHSGTFGIHPDILKQIFRGTDVRFQQIQDIASNSERYNFRDESSAYTKEWDPTTQRWRFKLIHPLLQRDQDNMNLKNTKDVTISSHIMFQPSINRIRYVTNGTTDAKPKWSNIHLIGNPKSIWLSREGIHLNCVTFICPANEAQPAQLLWQKYDVSQPIPRLHGRQSFFLPHITNRLETLFQCAFSNDEYVIGWMVSGNLLYRILFDFARKTHLIASIQTDCCSPLKNDAVTPKKKQKCMPVSMHDFSISHVNVYDLRCKTRRFKYNWELNQISEEEPLSQKEEEGEQKESQTILPSDSPFLVAIKSHIAESETIKTLQEQFQDRQWNDRLDCFLFDYVLLQ
jgi:hypothetical protein